MSTNTLNQSTTQPTMQQRLLGDRVPTMAQLFLMRERAAQVPGRLDALADLFLDNLMFASSTGHTAMARQAAFDLECVRLIRGARK